MKRGKLALITGICWTVALISAIIISIIFWKDVSTDAVFYLIILLLLGLTLVYVFDTKSETTEYIIFSYLFWNDTANDYTKSYGYTNSSIQYKFFYNWCYKTKIINSMNTINAELLSKTVCDSFMYTYPPYNYLNKQDCMVSLLHDIQKLIKHKKISENAIIKDVTLEKSYTIDELIGIINEPKK